ncbi:hypothetical protein STCU_06457 [Strigomonas culicis]|nr:hypothetical protein STCU_06457 [Strigomonas culicis]|eukprot:EPY25827.1 hypothetical protein STCU_06457 [Strigomonas culicis]
MFQYPVFENELDTPSLFHMTPPPNFFLYWNAADFERTAYPAVPSVDHRLLVPSESSALWCEHRERALEYLRKHSILPNYLPHIKADVNVSVVFNGAYLTRAKLDEETGALPPPLPPVSELTRRNFWFTAHCGNYIELCELQQPPSIFITESERDARQESYYTLLMMSPDYPYRVPSAVDRSMPDSGFFLNYMVTNIPGGKVAQQDGQMVNSKDARRSGDVVVPYCPPLPTEDAGTTRHICVLYRQTEKVAAVHTLTAEEEQAHFPLASRSQFFLLDPARSREGVDQPAALRSLREVEHLLVQQPSAATFFQTKWDIQVQEYYERVGLPEPALPIDPTIEQLLEFHARSSADLRVRARHRADGSVNVGDNPNFWAQYENTNMMGNTMGALWSRRTKQHH